MPSIKKILITAGPTREMLDPVRFLSNLSTGEMGYALARVARKKKYKVTLVSGPTGLKPPWGVRFVPVVSAQDMKRACERHFPSHDALVMTAAVCDFTATSPHRHKIHRTHTKQFLLRQTPDIVAGLARKKGRRLILGFCLETQDWLQNALRKLRRKKLDGIVANYYRPGYTPFGHRPITVAFVEPSGRIAMVRNRSKEQVSAKLLAWLSGLNEYNKRHSRLKS